MLLESQPRTAPTPVTEPELLETAATLGRQLCRDALWSGDRCNWLGDRMENLDGRWQVVYGAGGPDLYGGTAGIGLFLARLWRFTEEPLLRRTALGALRQAVSRREDLRGPAGMGFYSGLPGLAWAADAVAEASGDGETAEAVAALASELETLESVGIDVIGGSAGAIPALLSLARRLDRPGLRSLAIRCGEHLLETARDAGDGASSWDTLCGSPRDLTGFAHGTAGIAWALAELAEDTGDDRFGAAARAAVLYEQRWFDPQRRNWPDFRDHSETLGAQTEPIFALAWCHGAPGIGLGRLRSWKLTGDDELLEQATVAVEATAASLARPAEGNFSLCHGHGGNAELLVYSSTVLARPDLLEAARVVGRTGTALYHRQRQPWPCGVPDGGETPGLMTGLAGIGYFYLRLAAPERVPPVLILDEEV